MLKSGIESSLHDVGLENDLHDMMSSCRDVHSSDPAMMSCCSSGGDCSPKWRELWSHGVKLLIWNGCLMVGRKVQVDQ